MDTELIERVVALLPSEQDVKAVRDLARDLDELIAGVRKLAAEALEALRRGDQAQAVRKLERMAEIE